MARCCRLGRRWRWEVGFTKGHRVQKVDGRETELEGKGGQRKKKRVNQRQRGEEIKQQGTRRDLP